MPRIRFAFSVAAALLLLASVASADDGPGNDRVRLKNGGMLRGVVVESQPGGSVKVLVAGDKEPRVIPWADVAGVDLGKFDAPSAPAPAPAPLPPPPPRVAPPPPPEAPPEIVREVRAGVFVHIKSPTPVVLHSSTDTFGSVGRYGVALHTLNNLCTSPCDEPIDVLHEPELSIGGHGVTESARFSLDASRGSVNLDVSPGNRGTYIAGLWLTGAGAGLAVAGLALVAVEASSSSTPQSFNADGTTTSTSNSGLVTAAAVMAGVGGAMLIGGIVAIVEGRTTVDVHSGTAAPEAARAPRYWAGEF